jgi:hypothetical protein
MVEDAIETMEETLEAIVLAMLAELVLVEYEVNEAVLIILPMDTMKHPV